MFFTWRTTREKILLLNDSIDDVIDNIIGTSIDGVIVICKC